MGEARRRSIPSLRDWLAKNLASDDLAGRDEFAAYMDWVARMLDQAPPSDKLQAMHLRMIQAASLAIVETSNDEVGRGSDLATIMTVMCKALGASFGYAMMSLTWKDGAPVRRLAKPLTLEFERGLKFAIDSCFEQETADASDQDG